MRALMTPQNENRTTPGRAKNQRLREMAHAVLDDHLDSVEDIRGAFGNIIIDVQYQDGYFQAIEDLNRRKRRSD